jgi:hypothetical protein
MASNENDAPAEVKVGSILVSLLDPNPGEEVAFHRWYERDHFYSGCMAGAHFFAGRRFVATRALKDERLPEHGSMLDELRDGSYLALYWILAGHHEEAERWAVERVNALYANDRMFPGSRPMPAHAGFYLTRFSVSRDPDGVPAELALDHPFAGVGLTMWEAPPAGSVDALATALEDRLLPESIATSGPSSGPALCLGLRPVPLPKDSPAYVDLPEGLDRRILVVSFFQEDPAASMRSWTQGLQSRLDEAGLGKLLLSAPFIPTIPGTDRYADELW